MSPQTYTLDDITAEMARREAARKAAAGQSLQDGATSSVPENPRAGLFASHAPSLMPAMDTSASPARTSFAGAPLPPEAATVPPENPRAELFSNGRDEGQSLTDYGVTLRKALDRTGAALSYGLQKMSSLYGGVQGPLGNATGQAIRDFYHEREDTAPQQSESFKRQEAMPWSEAIKHPVTAAGKLAGDALSAAPDMALATAATMATGGAALPGIAKAALGGAAGGTAFGVGAAERAAYEMEKMPEEQLRATPAFQDAYAKTPEDMPEADRVAQARKEAANSVANATFGANVGLGAVTGGTLGPAAGALKKWAPGLVSSVIAGAGEGAGFMGGQTVADHAVRQANIDPNVSLTEGLPDAMIGGAVFGGTHALVKGNPVDTKARKQFVDAMAKDLESGAIATYTPEELAKTTQAASQFYQTDPDNRTLYRSVMELDQEAKRRANQPESLSFSSEQPAETTQPQFTRQGLARLAIGDLDAKDALYDIADAYGIKDPHKMEPADLVDSIMQGQADLQAAADMRAQAEQARQDILAAQDEAGRLDAIKRFEAATTSLAQTPALPAGTQDFALVGEPTPRTMTSAQRDQMARQVMQPEPEWATPEPEPQTVRGSFDRENEEAFGGSIPYAVPDRPATPPMDDGARRYLETRAQGLDSTINEAAKTGSEPDAKAVAEREAIGQMLSEDDAARASAQQPQETFQTSQEGNQAVLPGEVNNAPGQTPNVPQEAATTVQAPPATPESFARAYGIPETPEFLDAIRMYQEITGEGARGPVTEPQPTASPATIPAEGPRVGMEPSPQGQTAVNIPGQEVRSTEPMSPLPAGSVETPMVEKWLAPVRDRLASHINLKVVGSPEEIPPVERAHLTKADPNWMSNAGAATKDGSYILAWNLGGDRNEVRALATHEVKHQAMFRMFERMAEEKPYNGMATQQMARVLDPLIKARQGEITTLGRQQFGDGFDPTNKMHMLVGASEWLANAKNVEPKAYEKFMAAVRAALRSVGEKLDIHWLRDLKMSDAEIKTVNARIMREALQPDVPMGEMPGYADLGLQPVSQGVPAAGDMVGFRRGSESIPAVMKPTFEDPAVEARFREAAKGIGDQRGMVERGKTWLEEQAAGFTRHFIHMPNTPEYAEAHEALRQLEAAPTAAKEEAVRNLRTVTGKLSSGAYDLFTRKVILDDLAHEASLGHDLPFGFTPETMAKEKAKLDRWAENVPEVKDALATRKAIMDDLTGKLVDAGILSEDQVKNPAYFRHEVLKYAREWQQSQGTGTALKKPKPGYAKGREGSTEDISANYLEVEYATMQRAMVDLKTAETLKKIQGKYDVMPDVKAAAQEANARALAAMGINAKDMTEGQKRETLGGKYKTWENLIPEGYDRFQADKGLIYHTGNGITDKAMLSLMDALQMDDKAFQAQAPEVILDVLNGVRQQITVGGKKPEMILPKPIVETLNNLRPKAEKGFYDNAIAKAQGTWKQWVLINPRRVIKYNLNNMAGDLDAVLAGNPKALTRLPEAIRELRDVMKGGDPSQDYRDAVARGVFDSGLSVQEIPDMAKLDAFQNLVAERSGKNSLANPLTWARNGWRTLKDFTQFRENWMRLAAYKDYLRRIEAGENMRSIGYGAADPKIVDALSDPKDKAAMLARTLVGDYGAVSHYGQGIRKYLIPFYSWMEVNTKRYGQLMKNAFDQGIGQGFKTAGLAGAMLGARASVYLGLRMAAMYGLISTYNHLFHGDEEESLSPLDRQQLHVILGRDKDGNVHSLRLQGALSDFLDWFGFSDAVAAMQEMQNGRGSYGDVLKAVAKAPVNKIAGGLTPFIKTPLELAMGRSLYPDVFNPRPMQDRAREAARLFSAENEYDAFMNKPTRGYWKSWIQAVDYSRNVGEISYNNTMDRIRQFKEDKGVEGAGDYSTPKSRAIREYKQAVRFGDDKAAESALGRMVILGVSRDDLEKSLIRSAPLAGLARKDRAEFMATLTPKEQDHVHAAEDWYKDTFLDTDELKTRYDFHELQADYNLFTKQKKELIKTGNHEAAHALAVQNDLGRKAALIARVRELNAAKKRIVGSRMPEADKSTRVTELDSHILRAMGRAVDVANGKAGGQ